MILTKGGTLIATGHTRIVNGYYEIPGGKIVSTNIYIPFDSAWRTSMGKTYYIEYSYKLMQILPDLEIEYFYPVFPFF